MTVTIGLLVILALPVLAWFGFRYRPHRRQRSPGAATGPRHRWWQP